jgi:hypothetical protein
LGDGGQGGGRMGEGAYLPGWQGAGHREGGRGGEEEDRGVAGEK